jgi:ribonuclease HII
MPKKFDLSCLPAHPNLSFEQDLWAQGFQAIAGLDEAGRGAWAGPVFAAAVIFPLNIKLTQNLSAIDDSKQLTQAQREACAVIIKGIALDWRVGYASAGEIDLLGILPATRLAMSRAIQGLKILPDYLLVDYISLPEILLPQLSLVKGDARSLSIAAASILAKTARDAEMVHLSTCYTGYGFERHKGYGTALHQKMLSELGVSDQHRTSFRPAKAFIK